MDRKRFSWRERAIAAEPAQPCNVASRNGSGRRDQRNSSDEVKTHTSRNMQQHCYSYVIHWYWM